MVFIHRATCPFMTIGIEQLQTALYLLQSYAASALVFALFGEIAIADVAMYLLLFLCEADMDKTWLSGAYAMLEGILHQ